MRLFIGVIGGGVIGGIAGALLSGDFAFVLAIVGAVIGAVIANRGRRVTMDSTGDYQDSWAEGSGDDGGSDD